MASELLKRQALINKLKEPNVEDVNFDLVNSSIDYSIESITEDILPEPKPAELFQEREKVRSERLLDTINKIGGGLMDESLDFIRRNEMAIGGGLISGTDLGTREGFAGIRYNLKPLGGEGNEYIKTFTTKGGEKRYFFQFSRGGITRKFTAPFTPAGLKEVKKVRAETLEEFKKSGFKEKAIVKLKRPPNPNKPWRFKSTARGTEYFATEAEAKAEQARRVKAKFEGQTKIPPKDFEKIKKRILKGETLDEIAKTYDAKRTSVARLLRDNNTSYTELTPNVTLSKQKGKSLFLNNPKNIDYVQKNYGALKNETMAKALFPDLPISTAQSRVRKIINKLLDEKKIKPIPGSLIKEVREERGFNPKESAKRTQKERRAALKKFSVPAFETAMQGSKASQLSHMADLYNEVVRFETLGYSPQRINQEIFKNVDPYLKGLVEKRAKLLKNKPPGYAAKVNEINKKGEAAARATKGYKSFEVIEPSGKTYSVGVDYAKTVDPLGMFEGKTLQEIAPDKISTQSPVLKQMIPDDVERYTFVKNAKAVQAAQKKVSEVDIDAIAEEIESRGFETKRPINAYQKNKVKNLIASLSPDKRCQGKFGGGGSPPTLDYCFEQGKKVINDVTVKPGGAQFRNFAKLGQYAAKTGKTVAGAVDLLVSVGPGLKGAGVGVLLETGLAMEELSKGQPGLGFSKTFLGDVYNLIVPEEKEFNIYNRLLKSAETEEERVAIQNVADFDRDSKSFNKKLRYFDYLQNAPEFEREGADMVKLEKELDDLFLDIQKRKPKVINQDVGNILSEVAVRVGEEGRELLEGPYGKFFGRRQLKDTIMQPITLGKGYFDAAAPVPTDVLGVPMYESPGDTASGFDQLNLPTSFETTPEELDDIYEEGIMGAAQGGRIGFAEGPKNPGRRFFLKLMGGIMTLPVIGKYLKPLAPVVKQLPNTTTKMPEWFPQLVERMMSSGTATKITKNTPGENLPLLAEEATIYEHPNLPGVRLEKYDNGVIKIEGLNAYNEPYELQYEPPGEYKSLQTGKIEKTKGDFAAADTKYYRTGDPREMDYDVDYSLVEDLDDILGGNSTELEGFAKGTGESKYTKGQRAVDEADAQFSSDEPLSDNPAYRPSDARADVIEGPDIDLSDYYDD